MLDTRQYAGPRWLGFVLSAIALITLILGMANTPFIEWQIGDYILGVLLALAVVGFFYASYQNVFTLFGSMAGRTALRLACVAAIVSAFVIGANIFSDTWTVLNVLFVGGFFLIFVMGVAMISLSAEKIRDGR